MEFINRIELAGVVGRIQRQTVSSYKMANFSLVTEYGFKDKSSCSVIETTWHNVVAWEGEHIPSFDGIERGSHVRVIGRLRARRYTDSSGESRTLYEVVASSVEVLSNDCLRTASV